MTKGADKKAKVPQFVRLIDRLVTDSDLNQREIAEAIGYDKANIVTMFKKGTTRVPLNKVPALAEALGEDPIDLINVWLQDYAPEMKETLDKHLGFLASKHEKAWVLALRKTFPDGVPPCDERFDETFALLAKQPS